MKIKPVPAVARYQELLSHIYHRRHFAVFSCFLFLFTWLVSFSAQAGGAFSVAPVRIYMTEKDRATAVTLINEGTTPVVLQADINTWSQKPDGTDELVLTEDLILSPPIIKLAPNSRQVVRLVLLSSADLNRQLTYRLIVREIPEATAPPKENTIEVPIALALSMPIFITPSSAKREVNCTLIKLPRQDVQAKCTNSGTAYAQIREVLLQRSGKTFARFEGGVYILPGAQKLFAFKATDVISPGAAEIVITFDDGKNQTAPVIVQ